MKIAIPTADGNQIFPHFGRTPGFAIIEINNNKVMSKEWIENNITGHGRGGHNHHGDGDGQHHHHGERQHHSHDHILQAFEEVAVVIANGAGRRIVDDLKNAGKELITTRESDVDKAVDLYLKGELKHDPDIGCGN
jgi:predicted Fe-Mo cluster-binding NifX family protein